MGRVLERTKGTLVVRQRWWCDSAGGATALVVRQNVRVCFIFALVHQYVCTET